MAKLIFISGGARSGKSSYALQRAEEHSGELLYLATGAADDSEMAERIARHQQERGPRWQTVEEPLEIGRALVRSSPGKSVAILDCVTLWVTNLLLQENCSEQEILGRVNTFLEQVHPLDMSVYIITNEVGQGIVPENDLARLFRDIAGRVNQRLAAGADEAWVVISGLPLQLK